MKMVRSFLVIISLVCSASLAACTQTNQTPMFTATKANGGNSAGIAPSEVPTLTPAKPTSEAGVTPTAVEPTATEPVIINDTGLNSYTVHFIKYEKVKGGKIDSEKTNTVILEPFAAHYSMMQKGQNIEMIMIGQQLWIKMMDQPWTESQVMDGSNPSTKYDSAPMQDARSEVGVPLEDSLVWLTGQPRLNIAKGSLTRSGEESINGVACIKYTIDSTVPVSVTMTTPFTTTAVTTYHDQGTIWVANQDGMPAFIVRAELSEKASMFFEGNLTQQTFFIEQYVIDINSTDIKIEPPV